MNISTISCNNIERINFEHILKEIDKMYPDGVVPILSARQEVIKILSEFGYVKKILEVDGNTRAFLIKNGTTEDAITSTITRWKVCGIPIGDGDWYQE